MKTIFAFIALLAVVFAAPQNPADRDAVVVRSELDNIGVDGYNWAYETSNGISASEQGQLNNAGTENEIMAVRGQFSYVGADGVTYTVTYIADENGFQPQGAHLPKAP
ncbi:flexible cuticle protein 12-like [Atheta coriaria]|uniref:flexible cuticle protein 12-like n=1 Tax=Dalotia coriaria TaxID=877792 RepID=UPI0031F43D89